MAQGEPDRTTLLQTNGAKRCLAAFSPWFAVLSFWLMTGCNSPGRPSLADLPASPDQSLDFGVLYGRNCAGCHGSDGVLGPAPPLNDPLFRAIVPQKELQGVLVKGRKHSLMPAFAKESGGMLTEAQIQVLVMEIKGMPYKIVRKDESGEAKVEVVADVGGIPPKWGDPGMPPKGAPSYREQLTGSSGAGNEKRGSLVFARACAACHGNHGQGIHDESGTVRAIHEPAFLALMSDQILRRYAITGRPDLGMPSYAKARPDNPNFAPLTNEEVADVVALLASWRKEQ